MYRAGVELALVSMYGRCALVSNWCGHMISAADRSNIGEETTCHCKEFTRKADVAASFGVCNILANLPPYLLRPPAPLSQKYFLHPSPHLNQEHQHCQNVNAKYCQSVNVFHLSLRIENVPQNLGYRPDRSWDHKFLPRMS